MIMSNYENMDGIDKGLAALVARVESPMKATIAAQSEKIDLALIIIGEGKKNMCGEKICMSYLKDIKEALEGDQT